jgi:DNA-binding transcriptional ArsR family regulator
MQECNTAIRTIAHNAALAVVEAFKKAGGKIKLIPCRQRSDILKGTINKTQLIKSTGSVILAGLNPTEKVRAVLAKYKKMTRCDIVEHTGLSAPSISRAAKTLEADGFITRGPSGKGREVLFTVVES